MGTIDSILGMIATEAFESTPIVKSDLPPIQYDLELIQHPDGMLEWVE